MADPKEEQEETQDEAAARRKARRKARAQARAEESSASAQEEPEGDEAEEGAEDEDEDESEEGAEASPEEGEKGEKAAAKPNRHERRRSKKVGGDDLPKDRNARVRAKHKAKARRAEAEDEALTPLSTSEMLDDAVARGSARLGKWANANATFIGYFVIALILGGAGYGIYSWQVTGKAELASSELMQAVGADRARIDPAGPKPAAANEEDDPFQVFKTPVERNTAALAGYRKARSARADSGTALLARLGEAGVLLDQRSFDEALAAYREVKASQLAAADPDVRGRCIEGIGFALEGKGDADGALKVFKELETIPGVKTYKELGMYHQARLLAAKGDKEQALKLTKDARERLQTTGEARNASYLSGVLEELQRKIDPSSMPKRSLGGPGGQASLDELQKLQQQVLQEVEKAQKKGGHQDEH